MHKTIACAVLSAAGLMLAGCLPLSRTPEPAHLSLKDDVPKPPKSRPGIAVEDRARAEQWERCAQRHVDYQAGRLNETVEQKQMRDEICAELHRSDHARQ